MKKKDTKKKGAPKSAPKKTSTAEALDHIDKFFDAGRGVSSDRGQDTAPKPFKLLRDNMSQEAQEASVKKAQQLFSGTDAERSERPAGRRTVHPIEYEFFLELPDNVGFRVLQFDHSVHRWFFKHLHYEMNGTEPAMLNYSSLVVFYRDGVPEKAILSMDIRCGKQPSLSDFDLSKHGDETRLCVRFDYDCLRRKGRKSAENGTGLHLQLVKTTSPSSSQTLSTLYLLSDFVAKAFIIPYSLEERRGEFSFPFLKSSAGVRKGDQMELVGYFTFPASLVRKS